jgi:hypothetical protein
VLDPVTTMKKAALIPMIFALATAGLAAEASAEGTVVVRTVKGNARVVRNGQETPLTPDARLHDGDVIRTGEGETLDFAMNAVAGARVLPDSECEIEKSSEEDMVVRLQTGKVMTNLKKLKRNSSFRVATPTAIATVRGTQFLSQAQSVGEDGVKSTFSVRDDAVQVQRLENGNPIGDPVIVEAGFSCDVFLNEVRELAPRPATGAEIAVMEQASVVKSC